MRPVTPLSIAAAAAALALAAAGAAQAATCSCVIHHHRRATPAHYYAPSYRSHRLARHVAYAPAWGYGPPVVEEEPVLEPPLLEPVYAPAPYPPPPPPPMPAAYAVPGYEAVDAAYVGPDPGWRPAPWRPARWRPVGYLHARHRQCHPVRRGP